MNYSFQLLYYRFKLVLLVSLFYFALPAPFSTPILSTTFFFSFHFLLFFLCPLSVFNPNFNLPSSVTEFPTYSKTLPQHYARIKGTAEKTFIRFFPLSFISKWFLSEVTAINTGHGTVCTMSRSVHTWIFALLEVNDTNI